jgi:hypothetical protein
MGCILPALCLSLFSSLLARLNVGSDSYLLSFEIRWSGPHTGSSGIRLHRAAVINISLNLYSTAFHLRFGLCAIWLIIFDRLCGFDHITRFSVTFGCSITPHLSPPHSLALHAIFAHSPPPLDHSLPLAIPHSPRSQRRPPSPSSACTRKDTRRMNISSSRLISVSFQFPPHCRFPFSCFSPFLYSIRSLRKS